MSDNSGKNLSRRFQNMNPHVLQRPQNPPIPATPIRPVQSQKMACKKGPAEFIKLEQHPTGLYAVDVDDRFHFLSEMQIHSVIHVKPNVLYKKGDFYEIKVNDSVIHLTPTEYDNNTTVYNKLIEASNCPIKKFVSDVKLKKLFKEFLSTKYSEIALDFYFGWKRKENNPDQFAFYLFNEKTHAIAKNMALDIVPNDLVLPEHKHLTVIPHAYAYNSFQNTLAQNIATLFETITNTKLRSIFFLTVHAAALYSLLMELGSPLNIGLFINCENARINHSFCNLFKWYDDDPIPISETDAAFKSLLSQRKDQPLLIKDFNCKTDNRDTLTTSIRNGSIYKLFSNSENQAKLQALPIIISDYHSPFSVSSEFIHLEITSSDLSEDACATMRRFTEVLHEYIKYFIAFVQKNTDLLKRHLTSAKDSVFREKCNDIELTEQKLLALCCLRGLEKIIRDYHESFSIEESTTSRLNNLISADWYDFVFSQLSNHDYEDTFTPIIRHFSDALKDFLRKNEIFDMRKRSDPKNGTNCDPNKKGIVYLFDNCVCLSKEAFSYVRDSCNIPPRKLLEAFRETEFLIESNWNTECAPTRRKVDNSKGEKFEVKLYMIPFAKLGLGTKQQPSCKKASFDYKIELGETEDGDSIIFSAIEDLNNHVYVSGQTGSGKSYKLMEMISQLPSQGVRCILFASTRDFSPTSEKYYNNLPAKDTDVINFKDSSYSILPFCAIYEDESIDFRSERILNCISSLGEFGDKQKERIRKSLTSFIKSSPDTANYSNFCLHFMLKDKKLSSEDKLQDTLNNLCNYLPDGSELVDWHLDTPGITVVDLYKNFAASQIPKIIQLITGYIIHLRKYDKRKTFSPVVFVYDECQELSMHEDTQIAYLLRQGRKLGFSGWFSTQWLTKESSKNALGDVKNKIYFSPAKANQSEAAQEIYDLTAGSTPTATKSGYRSALSSLGVGQFIYVANKQAITSCDPKITSTEFSLDEIIF